MKERIFARIKSENGDIKTPVDIAVKNYAKKKPLLNAKIQNVNNSFIFRARLRKV
jgi:hypothetical protein